MERILGSRCHGVQIVRALAPNLVSSQKQGVLVGPVEEYFVRQIGPSSLYFLDWFTLGSGYRVIWFFSRLASYPGPLGFVSLLGVLGMGLGRLMAPRKPGDLGAQSPSSQPRTLTHSVKLAPKQPSSTPTEFILPGPCIGLSLSTPDSLHACLELPNLHIVTGHCSLRRPSDSFCQAPAWRRLKMLYWTKVMRYLELCITRIKKAGPLHVISAEGAGFFCPLLIQLTKMPAPDERSNGESTRKIMLDQQGTTHQWLESDKRKPSCDICVRTQQRCQYPSGLLKPGPRLGKANRVHVMINIHNLTVPRSPSCRVDVHSCCCE